MVREEASMIDGARDDHDDTGSDELEQFDREFTSFCCAVRRFVTFCEREARKAGMTGQQYLLLLAVRGLSEGEAATMGDIVTCLQTPRSAASHLIDACLRAGHISRRDDAEDRRRALISLTPHGEEVLNQVSVAARQHLASLKEEIFRDSLRQALT